MNRSKVNIDIDKKRDTMERAKHSASSPVFVEIPGSLK